MEPIYQQLADLARQYGAQRQGMKRRKENFSKLINKIITENCTKMLTAS